MDQYSREHWVLDRHREMAREAEVRSRLLGAAAGAPVVGRVATLLRRLADRLDGGAGAEPSTLSPTSSS